jgi:hypothetical protein
MMKWGLEDLSDRKAQERVWLGNSATEMSSFEEAVCATFDDSGLSDVLNSKLKILSLSAEFLEKVTRLEKAIRKIPDQIAPMAVINHRAMEEVRVAATDLLNYLNAEPDLERR